MDHYAVFGNPISHSLSPKIHQAFAQQTQQALIYEAICPPLDGFTETAKKFLAEQGQGFNVTVPFKEQAFKFVDQLKPRAQLAKAVNTIGKNADGSTWGDNTDGVGLIRDLTQTHQLSLSNLTILIIGAGGAIRGVLGPLLEQQPKKIIIANRTYEKAQLLAEEFKMLGNIQAVPLNALNESFDLIINGSAASLSGENISLPNIIIQPQHTICYDMMYDLKKPTPFNVWAQQQQAKKSFDGLGMLVEQAAEAFYLWRGVKPETQPIIALLGSQ